MALPLTLNTFLDCQSFEMDSYSQFPSTVPSSDSYPVPDINTFWIPPTPQPDQEALNAIVQAFLNVNSEDPMLRFIAEEECTLKGMEAKEIREFYSEHLYNDRHEADRQLRSSLPPRSNPMDRVAKWIVRNDLEITDFEYEESRISETTDSM